MDNNKDSRIKLLNPEEIKKAEKEDSLIGVFGYKIIFLPIIGSFYIAESYKSDLESFLFCIFFVVFTLFFLLKSTSVYEMSDWKGWVVGCHGSPSYVDAPTPLILVKFLLWIVFFIPLILFILKSLNVITFSLL